MTSRTRTAVHMPHDGYRESSANGVMGRQVVGALRATGHG